MGQRSLGVAVLMACLAACGSSDAAAPSGGAFDAGAVAGVRFDSAVAPFRQHSGILTSRRAVIDNEGDWLTTWDELTSASVVRPNPPDVDFDKYMILLVSSGSKPTGGYCIDIGAVVGFPNGVFVLVDESDPSPDWVVTDGATQPTDLKLVPRTSAGFRFETDHQMARCP